jgi:arylsulfatase A-like enzyme
LRNIKGGERLLRNPLSHYLFDLFGVRMPPARLYVSAERLQDQFVDWVKNAEAPYFAWLHYMDVHWPYHKDNALDTPYKIAQAWKDLSHMHRINWKGEAITAENRERYFQLYKEAVKYTDFHIGQLFQFLERSGQLENTVVIILSDHGEEFFEREHWGHFEINLFDEILKVPLIVSLPGNRQGKIVDAQVSTLDIMPTLLELCHCPIVPGMEGRSLMPLLNGQANGYDRQEAISEMWRPHRHIVALRNEEYKYIWDSENPDQPKFFDLSSDPKEQDNLYQKNPKQVKYFHEKLSCHLEKANLTQPESAASEMDYDEDMVRRLRDLGYLE